ncbi:MAG: toxic anion resistance protein [Oscillospiraceae bacterium]|nr:toxic anion resistance protein [Oscillospiraceae bacterium]MBR3849720.1 toxic anion resistance protein [Oscillospiraceae bacterium]
MADKEHDLTMNETVGSAAEAAVRLPEAAEFEKMTEEEQQAIKEFSAKIDVRDEQMIRQYGVPAQKRMAEFSEAALTSAKNTAVDALHEALFVFTAALKEIDDARPRKGFLAMFGRTRRSEELLREACGKLPETVGGIAEALDAQRTALLQNVDTLSQLYDKNLDHYKLITMYILAGKLRAARDRETTLASMREIVRRTDLPQDVQAANDFENAIRRFEKRLHELEVLRIVCIQMAPQLRLLQKYDADMADGIQSFVVNAVPAWRYKAGAESGDTDPETFHAANEELTSEIETLLRIGQSGAKVRNDAETELQLIETDLKKKLLEYM